MIRMQNFFVVDVSIEILINIFFSYRNILWYVCFVFGNQVDFTTLETFLSKEIFDIDKPQDLCY